MFRRHLQALGTDRGVSIRRLLDDHGVDPRLAACFNEPALHARPGQHPLHPPPYVAGREPRRHRLHVQPAQDE